MNIGEKMAARFHFSTSPFSSFSPQLAGLRPEPADVQLEGRRGQLRPAVQAQARQAQLLHLGAGLPRRTAAGKESKDEITNHEKLTVPVCIALTKGEFLPAYLQTNSVT